MAGIDVGEDFLDLATFSPANRDLSLARVDLRTISPTPAERSTRSQVEASAVTSLRAILIETVPELAGATVLVDSPRWPRDLDWTEATGGGCSGRNEQTSLPAAHNTQTVVAPYSRQGREIDAGLRALVSTLRRRDTDSTLGPLSMFPTPPMRYFGAHLNVASCKPHLRSLGQALFGEALNRDYGPASGGIFTRFMIAGFATYRALETVAAEVYECYPDLQFKLWCRGQRLLSKNSTNGRNAALASRIHVLSSLARKSGVRAFPQIKRMDEADAAILALSTAVARKHGMILVVKNAGEGKFMVAMRGPEARRLQQRWTSLLNPETVDPHHDLLEE